MMGSVLCCAEPVWSESYLPYDPDQQLLLPAAIQEWLPEGHLAYFISDLVEQTVVMIEKAITNVGVVPR